MINPWLILGFVLSVLGAAGVGYWRGEASGELAVQQKWDKERAVQLAEYAKAQEEMRERERQLQDSADLLRKEKDREIRDIAARNTALANSLRNRPERSTQTGQVSGTAGACSGATGKELARPDGEFLAGYAADAARLQAALTQCIAQYNQAREMKQ